VPRSQSSGGKQKRKKNGAAVLGRPHFLFQRREVKGGYLTRKTGRSSPKNKKLPNELLTPPQKEVLSCARWLGEEGGDKEEGAL